MKQCAFLAIAVLAIAAAVPGSAVPSFYAVGGLSGNGQSLLFEVDFEGGELIEVGALGFETTSLAAEPGTGRLITWAGGDTPGFYEIDRETAATTFFVPTPDGLELRHLAFDHEGTLWGGPTVPGVPWSTEQVSLDLSTGLVTGGGPTGLDLVAFAWAPDGTPHRRERTGHPNLGSTIPEDLFIGVDAFSFDDQGVALILGRTDLASYATTTVIGSAGNPIRDAPFVTTFQRWDPETNVVTRVGAYQRAGFAASDVAFVPEPTTVGLLSIGLALLGYSSRRRRAA